MSKQLDLFSLNLEEMFKVKDESSFPMYQSNDLMYPNVADVRTKVQQKRKVSFDVGTKIGGAPKDLEEKRNLYKLNPNVGLLEEIAAEDDIVANELAKKSHIFSWFSLEKCQENNVHIHAAYGMSLFIRRVSSHCSQVSMTRKQYIQLLLNISEMMKGVQSVEHFSFLLSRLQSLLASNRLYHYTHRKLDKINNEYESLLLEPLKNEKEIKRLLREQQQLVGALHTYDIGESLGLSALTPIVELVTSKQKLRDFNKSMQKYATWEKYKKETADKGNVKRGGSKPVWERKLPVNPKRTSEIYIPDMNGPAQFKEYFGFRAIEFGNWVEDSVGKAHLNNAAKALVDLAQLLGVSHDKLSLGQELALAFGARGKGRALGHYEPGYNVINLTKERGSLGILAHEWFHAFDYYLKKQIAPNHEGFLTAGADVFMLPVEIFEAYHLLMKSIKKGRSTAFIDVKGFTGSYRLTSKFIAQYEKHMGDLQDMMDSLIAEFDEKVDRHLMLVESEKGRQELKSKYERKRKTTLRKNAEALSQLHKERTGKDEYRIPYTTNQTQFYQDAIDLDRGKEGKYFSSNIELCARSFESYVYSLLKDRNWRSDYLVSGIDDVVFPKFDEKTIIHAAISRFIQVTISYL